MIRWQNAIIERIKAIDSKLIIVIDPDSIFQDTLLVQLLDENGFLFHDYTDSIRFRYRYEAELKLVLQTEQIQLIIRIDDNNCLDAIPWDILAGSSSVNVSLDELFEPLSSNIVKTLGIQYYSELYEAILHEKPQLDGELSSKDFILKHIFGIDSTLIKSRTDLMRILLRLHHNEIVLPGVFGDRLLELLYDKPDPFTAVLESLLYNKESFYSFLQTKWNDYILSLMKTDREITEIAERNNIHISFEDQEIRLYVEKLFNEDSLKPIPNPGADLTDEYEWLTFGIVNIENDRNNRLIKARIYDLNGSIPKEDSQHNEWVLFAQKYANILSKLNSSTTKQESDEITSFRNEVNNRFSQWITKLFPLLINLPANDPVMVHQIIKSIASERETDKVKAALLVIDGLSYSQWITIKDSLAEHRKKYNYTETGVFAWIPTTTSISRQAIFSGTVPKYFAKSINNTNNEYKLWKSFWQDYGLADRQLCYVRGLGNGDPCKALDKMTDLRQIQIIGLVVDKVDKIMHGMQLGEKGMHNQIAQWCRTGYLTTLLDYLLDSGFVIWITSDHGNIECTGKGLPAEGVVAESRGSRVRMYPSADLRDFTAAKYPSSQVWKPIGLPDGYYPLMAPYKSAFSNKGTNIVAHGGISLEEVIVPLVRISGR